MISLILASLWWTMPVFVALIYFAVGFLVCRFILDKKEDIIESAADYWFYFILWLPLCVIGFIWSVGNALWTIPKKIAESQINRK